MVCTWRGQSTDSVHQELSRLEDQGVAGGRVLSVMAGWKVEGNSGVCMYVYANRRNLSPHSGAREQAGCRFFFFV